MNTRKNKKTHKKEENKLNVETKKAKKLRKLTEEEIDELYEAIVNDDDDDEKAKTLVNIMDDINENIFGSDYSALILCCTYGRIDFLKYLLELGADVNKISDYGFSPLMGAIKRGNIEMVKLLIDSGADVNFINNEGISALSETINADNNGLEILELLISTAVDVAKCGGKALVSASIHIVKRLIELAVNVNFINPNNGWTALHYACGNSNLELVEYLMNNGANENILNNNGETAIKLTENLEIKEFINNYNSTKCVLK